VEKTKCNQRAKCLEKTSLGKRAIAKKKPSIHQRAIQCKKSMLKKRATRQKKTIIDKRARVFENTETHKRMKGVKMQKSLLKATVRSFYDAQKIRIELGNRLVANVRVRLGQDPGTKTEETMSREGQNLLKQLLENYRRIADGLTSASTKAKVKAIEQQPGIISDLLEYELTGHYLRLLDDEANLGKIMKRMVETFPIWDAFLKDVKGCGPTMAGVILSELDPHKARHVSSFWRYAGLDVGDDGKGRSRRKEHLTVVEYEASDGTKKSRQGITFNPFLKTKLVGVLGSSFLRSDSPYRQIYDDYKQRLDCHPTHEDKSKGHKHNMAIRYMVKMFLKDLWIEWRKIEGLPTTPDYAEAKLGRKHGA